MSDLLRLRQAALAGGDPESLERYARALERRGDLKGLQALADRDPAHGRRLAGRLIEAGHTPVVALVGHGPLSPLIELLDFGLPPEELSCALTAPLRVPLLWDARRERLFAIACAAEVLGPFEALFPEDRRLHEVLEATRGFAEGGLTREALQIARAQAEAAAYDAMQGEDFFELTYPEATWAAWTVFWAAWDPGDDPTGARKTLSNARHTRPEHERERMLESQTRRLLSTLLSPL